MTVSIIDEFTGKIIRTEVVNTYAEYDALAKSLGVIQVAEMA